MIRPTLRRRQALGGLGALTLAGCGGGSWLGDSEEPPLPGVRKPVLLIEEGVAADPRIAELNITLPPAIRNAEWPQAGGGATHVPGHLAAAASLTEAWQAGAGDGSSGRARLLASPIVAAGKVFTVDATAQARAFATSDGSELWRFEPTEIERNDRDLGGAAAYDAGRLFIVVETGAVVAVDAASGAEVWKQSIRAPVRSAPAVAEGRLLVPSADNQLFALDMGSGEILWRHTGLFEQAGILGGASPAAARGLALVAYSSGEVFALDLASGQPLWSETVLRPRRTLAIGAIPDIVADPVIDGDRVLVAGVSGEMAALDLARGGQLWRGSVTSTQMPWVAGEFIYLVTERGELVCLLRQGGRIRWVKGLGNQVTPDDPSSRRIRWAGPVLASDRLILASSEGEAVSVSPLTGELIGRVTLRGPVTLPPVIADGTVYFLTDEGELLAYR